MGPRKGLKSGIKSGTKASAKYSKSTTKPLSKKNATTTKAATTSAVSHFRSTRASTRAALAKAPAAPTVSPANNPGQDARGMDVDEDDKEVLEASLCFKEAFDAFENHKISEEEYFKHLLSHFQGVRHPSDLDEDPIHRLMVTEPVASSIRTVALTNTYEPLQSIELCEHLFTSCTSGDVDRVNSLLGMIQDLRSLLIQPLTMLAATKGQVEIFHICLKEAMKIDVDVYLAVRRGILKNPNMLDVLLAENWRNIQKSPKALNMLAEKCLIGGKDKPEGEDNRANALSWLLDHGAKIPGSEYRMMARYPPSIGVLKFLLELNPKNLLKYGMLQFAASEGNIDIVEILINAGANVNQIPPDFGDIREPGPYSALYMAVWGADRSSTEEYLKIARLLLEHGADMNKPSAPGRHEETPLQAARRLGDARMLGLLEGYIEEIGN